MNIVHAKPLLCLLYITKPRKTAIHRPLSAVSVEDIKYGGWKALWISEEYVSKDICGYFSTGLPTVIYGKYLSERVFETVTIPGASPGTGPNVIN